MIDFLIPLLVYDRSSNGLHLAQLERQVEIGFYEAKEFAFIPAKGSVARC